MGNRSGQSTRNRCLVDSCGCDIITSKIFVEWGWEGLRLHSPYRFLRFEVYIFLVKYLIASSHFYPTFFFLVQATKTELLFLIVCRNLAGVHKKNLYLTNFLYLFRKSKKYFQLLLKELHYLQNDITILTFGSELTGK